MQIAAKAISDTRSKMPPTMSRHMGASFLGRFAKNLVFSEVLRPLKASDRYYNTKMGLF